MFSSKASSAAPRRPLEPLLSWLEAEQERWFLWLPVLLGAGIPLFAGEAEALGLHLVSVDAYETGAVSLKYAVE